MTAQAASYRETFSFEQLLTEFLNCNRLAIEDSCKVSWTFEDDLWGDLAERCRRHDGTCNPGKSLTTVDEHARARARIGVATTQTGYKGSAAVRIKARRRVRVGILISNIMRKAHVVGLQINPAAVRILVVQVRLVHRRIAGCRNGEPLAAAPG